LLPVLHSLARLYGSPTVHHRHGPAGMGAFDSDDAISESAGDRRPPGGECGCAARGVDRAVGEGPSSKPPVRLRRQLRPLPRARLRGAGESLHAGPVLSLWRGAAQLHAERDLTGGHVRRRLRRVPGDPGKLGSLGHLFRAELHTLATSEPRTRLAARARGLSLALRSSRREEYIPCTMTSNNAEWERGWFYLRNADPGLPPTPARC
jgi:hypothetical protein